MNANKQLHLEVASIGGSAADRVYHADFNGNVHNVTLEAGRCAIRWNDFTF